MGNKRNGIPPLAKRAKDSTGEVSLPNYLTALRDILAREGAIKSGENWINAAALLPVYKFAPTVAKFLLFCATDDAVVDDAEPGLVKRGLRGRAPLFTFQYWTNESYYTVEHIAPRNPSDNWPEAFFKDPSTVHRLGNLILLPQEANSLIGDRPWKHKVMIYRLLAADTGDEQAQIEDLMKKEGLNLSKEGRIIIANADYNQTCKAITRINGDWSVDLIEKRSRRIAELAWQKLSKWIEFNDAPISPAQDA
jgi:hypothetical protein